MTDDRRLLSLNETAKALGVSWESARELVETGQLRAVRVGSRWRVPPSAVVEIGERRRG